VLEHSIHRFLHIFCPLAIVIQEIHRKNYFKKRKLNSKHEWNIICSFKKGRKGTFRYLYFDVLNLKTLVESAYRRLMAP